MVEMKRQGEDEEGEVCGEGVPFSEAVCWM